MWDAPNALLGAAHGLCDRSGKVKQVVGGRALDGGYDELNRWSIANPRVGIMRATDGDWAG